jgi:hypothetical protein
MRVLIRLTAPVRLSSRVPVRDRDDGLRRSTLDRCRRSALTTGFRIGQNKRGRPIDGAECLS